VLSSTRYSGLAHTNAPDPTRPSAQAPRSLPGGLLHARAHPRSHEGTRARPHPRVLPPAREGASAAGRRDERLRRPLARSPTPPPRASARATRARVGEWRRAPGESETGAAELCTRRSCVATGQKNLGLGTDWGLPLSCVCNTVELRTRNEARRPGSGGTDLGAAHHPLSSLPPHPRSLTTPQSE